MLPNLMISTHDTRENFSNCFQIATYVRQETDTSSAKSLKKGNLSSLMENLGTYRDLSFPLQTWYFGFSQIFLNFLDFL